MQIKKLPTQHYVDMINAGQPFAMPRYGDGEWAWILDIKHVNEEGHEWSPELGADLRASIMANHPLPYYYTMPQLDLLHYPTEVCHWLETNQPGPAWYDCSQFRIDSHAGNLWPLLDALRRKQVLVIGPEFLRGLGNIGLFSPAGFIAVPERNAYRAKDEIIAHLNWTLRRNVYEVITFSAGPLSKILIDRLWANPKYRMPLVDIGSLWDVYFGRVSRNYMRAMDPTTLQKNLGGV